MLQSQDKVTYFEYFGSICFSLELVDCLQDSESGGSEVQFSFNLMNQSEQSNLEGEAGCGISDAVDKVGVSFCFETHIEGHIDDANILENAGLNDGST